MPTTNPVPSSDPNDLVFNAQKLDEFVTGTNATFVDRLGNQRRTHAGLSAEFPSAVANAVAAAASASAAAASAAQSQAAMDATLLGANVYPTTAAGLVATTVGGYFSVPSAVDTQYLILYRHEAGTVAAAVKRYPSALAVEQLASVAALGDERSQAAAASAEITAEQLSIILNRLVALEQQKDETDMSTYSLAATALTTATTLVGAAPVTRLQLLNKSTATVGVSFGVAPAGVNDAGVLTLPPGAALDTELIPSTPIFVIASAASAEVVGAFSVPRGAPNPNFESDFAPILAGMGSVPSFAWESAYRRLYSALRRDGILAKTRGLYLPLSHSAAAGLQNWAAPGTGMVAVGAPSWVLGSGFVYDGVDDYHNTNLALQGYTTPTNVGAVVWTGDGPVQGVGKSALGDGAVSLEPNRTATLAAVKTGTEAADTVAMPGLGGMLGISRFASDRATVFRPGGKHATVVRASSTAFTPGRVVTVGASNSNVGIGSFYTGAIKAAFFGRALDAQQILAFEVAMNDYFTAAAEAIVAGV